MRKYLRVVSISRAPHRSSTRQQSIRHYMPVAYLQYKHSIMSFRSASRNYLPQNNCTFTWINMHESIMLNYDVLSESYYLILSFLLMGPSARTTCAQSSGREGLQGPPWHRDYNLNASLKSKDILFFSVLPSGAGITSLRSEAGTALNWDYSYKFLLTY